MKVGSKIFGTVMVCIFVIVLIASYITNIYMMNSFFENNEDIVLSQAEILARHVNNLLDDKKDLIVLLGSFALTDYILALQSQDEVLMGEKIKEAERRFQLFATQQKFDYFTEIKFINSRGEVLIKILNGRVVDDKKENLSKEAYFDLMKVWYEFDAETMGRLEKSFEPGGIERLEELTGNKFLEEELRDKLKDLNFSEDEIKIIREETYKTGKAKQIHTYFSPLFKKDQELAIDIACLVEGFDNENIGIIVVTYNLKDIYETFKDIKFRETWFAENSFAWLTGKMDGEGVIISYPEKYKYDSASMELLEADKNMVFNPSFFQGGRACLDYIAKNNERRIIAINPVNRAPDWYVVITIPYDTFFFTAEELQVKLLFIAIISLILLTVIIFIIILYFTKPLTGLAVDLNKLLESGQEEEFSFPGNDELSDIAGTFNILLERHMDSSKKDIQDINPLTGLPGNMAVQKKLFDIIDRGNKFAVAMVDIDNFGVYNQRYGFVRGDSVIRQTATIVTNFVKEYGNSQDFVGHLGGDDIIFVTTPDRVDSICQKIIEAFDLQILFYYTEEDKEKKGFTWKDKDGTIVRFPLMTLSIAVSTNEKRQIIHPLQISQIFSELLVYLKKQAGSTYFKDRRIQDRKTDVKGTATFKAEHGEVKKPEEAGGEPSPVTGEELKKEEKEDDGKQVEEVKKTEEAGNEPSVVTGEESKKEDKDGQKEINEKDIAPQGENK